MDCSKNINKRIRYYRKKIMLRQEDIAKLMQTNRLVINRIENGSRTITAEEIAKLAKIFGVSADILLYGDENECLPMDFAYEFAQLNDEDQAEIMNIINLKKSSKNELQQS